ncbi:MAG: glycosyltransferase family 39 protein [Deltaproteobacteria bacterium]|jgi:hypothetical protein|nr:glycosyltransferase family 39 protein [Deltaproteobacteria bacterium]
MNNSYSRADIYFLLFFFVFSGFYIFWTWNPELAGLGGDNGVYLLTANFYSPWSPPSDIARHFAERSQYPPLYPLLLALFGGGENILAAHLITTACLLLALIILRAWLISIGLHKTTANLAVMLFVLLPGTVRISMFILSENLYLLLSMLALYLATQAEKKKNSPWLQAAALVIVAATLTRTVGLSLAAAFCLYLALHRPRHGLVTGLAVIIPLLLYSGYTSLKSTEHASYFAVFASYYNSDTLIKIIDQVRNESFYLWQGWQANFESAAGDFLIGLCLAISLISLTYRVYKRRLDGYYILCYFLIILFWPYPAEAKRFMYVVLPIMVGQSFLLISHIPSLPVGKIKIYPVNVFIIALIFLSLPNTLIIADRLLQPLPPQLNKYRRTKHLYSLNPQIAVNNLHNAMILIEDMKDLNKKLPERAIIYGIIPSIISLYSNRLAFMPPSDINHDNSINYNGDFSRPVFFYMTALTSPSIPTPYYPLEKIRNRMEVLHMAKTHDGENAPVISILAKLTINNRSE